VGVYHTASPSIAFGHELVDDFFFSAPNMTSTFVLPPSDFPCKHLMFPECSFRRGFPDMDDSDASNSILALSSSAGYVLRHLAPSRVIFTGPRGTAEGNDPAWI
jgi:hypothetical protein